MSKNRWPRKQLFVDLRIQGALAVRVVLYWLMCLFAMGVLLVVWRVATMPLRPVGFHLHELWSIYGPAALASIFLLPIVLFDMLRLTNRFTGPMFRLRRSMRELAEGRTVETVRFRPGDFWQELATDFNAIAARLRESQQGGEQNASPPAPLNAASPLRTAASPDLAPAHYGIA